MTSVTLALPDDLLSEIARRAGETGCASREDYLVELIRSDCEQAKVDAVLAERWDGPFEPLEADWKQRVREAAQDRI